MFALFALLNHLILTHQGSARLPLPHSYPCPVFRHFVEMSEPDRVGIVCWQERNGQAFRAFEVRDESWRLVSSKRLPENKDVLSADSHGHREFTIFDEPNVSQQELDGASNLSRGVPYFSGGIPWLMFGPVYAIGKDGRVAAVGGDPSEMLVTAGQNGTLLIAISFLPEHPELRVSKAAGEWKVYPLRSLPKELRISRQFLSVVMDSEDTCIFTASLDKDLPGRILMENSEPSEAENVGLYRCSITNGSTELLGSIRLALPSPESYPLRRNILYCSPKTKYLWIADRGKIFRIERPKSVPVPGEDRY